MVGSQIDETTNDSRIPTRTLRAKLLTRAQPILAMLTMLLGCNPQMDDFWVWADSAVPPSEIATLQAIEVAGEPNGTLVILNGGLAQIGNRRLMAVRADRYGEARRKATCAVERTISVGELGSDGQFGDDLIALDLPGSESCDSTEDPRLIACNDKVFVVYNAETGRKTWNRRRRVGQFLAQLDVSGDRIDWHWAAQLASSGRKHHQDKNWTPFCYESELYFIEQTRPHTVSRLPQEQLDALVSHAGPRYFATKPLQLAGVPAAPPTDANVVWQAGPWRGGTPALYEPDLGEYISFFHSHLEVGKHRIYYAGIYTFAAAPPFAIRRYLAQPIALPKVANRFHPRFRVIFPVGLLATDSTYLLSYGEDDLAVALATFSKQEVLQALTELP